jgi:hypothetical protein
MTIKPFEIQGAQLKLGGLQLEAGTSSVVIPGVTRATSYRVEEVEDTNDQTQTFSPTRVTVIDYITYQEIVNDTGNGSGRADYITELDNEGYIDSLEVGGQGSYTQQEAADNAGNDMYGYIGSGLGSDRPIVPQDWVQIPFRPKMRVGEVEREGATGATSLSGLEDTDIGDASPGQALVWNGEVWTNQDVSSGGTNLPPDQPGFLQNDGEGGLSWGTSSADLGDMRLASWGYPGNNPLRITHATRGESVLVQTSDDPETGNQGRTSIRWHIRNEPEGNEGSRYSQVDVQNDGVWIKNADWSGSNGSYYWHFDGNGKMTLPEGGDIVDSNGASVLGATTTKTWTNPNENTWRIVEYSGGWAGGFTSTAITSTLTATAIETLSNVNYVDIDDSTFPGFYGGSIQSFTINGTEYTFNGNEWLGGGTTYRYYLSPNLSYSEGDIITATIVTGYNPPEPSVWWDAANSTNGSENFRGAIIEYHAFCNNGGTVIGKIIIAADDENAVTHMEAMSGGSNLAEYELWYAPNYGQLAVRRVGTDVNASDNQIWIQWTSKIFYGSEYWC